MNMPRACLRLLAAFVLGLAPGWTAHAADPAPAAKPALEFQRLIVNTGGEQAEACLRFDKTMDRRIEAHYGDYVRVTPAVAPAPRAQGRDLCLAGLDYGKTYSVTLLAGLASVNGFRLAADQTVKVALADRPSLVSIAGDGFILPRQTSTGVAIQTVNVDRLRIHVLRMGDRLLATQPGTPGSGGSTMGGYEIRGLLEQQASVVWVGTMAVPRQPNATVQTAFPLDRIIKDKGLGAYLIVAENAASPVPSPAFAQGGDDDYRALDKPLAAHWVIATDLALTTMSGQDGLHVFARSLASAKPAAGVDDFTDRGRAGCAGLGANGRGRAGSVRSRPAARPWRDRREDRDRVRERQRLHRARPVATGVRPQRPRRVRNGGGRSRARLSRHRARRLPAGRDGERDGAAAGTIWGVGLDGALTLTLRRPDGVQARRVTLAGGQADGFHQAFTLTGTAARGQWTVEARVDPTGPRNRTRAVRRAGFRAAAVEGDACTQCARVAARPETRVHRRWAVSCTGAPAAGLNGEATLRIMRDPDPVPDAKGYSFGLVDEDVKQDEQTIAMPDADGAGKSVVQADVKIPAAPSAPLKGVLTAGLFEPTGRLVSDQAELPIRNQALLIGVRGRVSGDAGFEAQTAASLDALVYDRNGHPRAAAGLRWDLIRENRVYDWFSANGSWTFHYHTVDEPVAGGTLDVAADRPATVSQNLDWGQYRFVVSDPATHAASSSRLSVGWATQSGDTATPDRVAVTAKDASLKVGQQTLVHVGAVFAGEAELVIANDRVLETRSLTIPKEGLDVPVTAGASWGPGAYVMVTMYRPLAEPARPHDPTRAVGLAYIAVDQRARTLDVALAAPAITLPRGPTIVPVHVTGGTAGQPVFLTLAAVDEGILQITRFASPDPAAFLFGKRQLGIDIRDDYGRLLQSQAQVGTIREGGDAGLGGPGLAVTSTKIVSLFSGPVAVDANGEARVPLDIPDFEGQLRLMAIAWSRDAVGSAHAQMIVRDPVFAQVDLPRFLAPGDQARINVSLVDNDGPAGAFHLDVTTSGPATIGTGAHVDATLAQGARTNFAMALDATGAGVAGIAADLTGPNGFKQHRSWSIAIRPAHYPITLASTARQRPGEVFKLDPRQLDTFVPGSVIVSVGYAGYAGLDASSLLQSLYSYPFGCTEQLASAAWPLIYFNDPGLLGRVPRQAGAKAKVQQAIDTIIDREDPAGRFGLWRVGDGQASPWLDIYAVDFLMHAKDGGFDVPDAALHRALGYVGEQVGQSDEYADSQFRSTQDETRAYGWYVLARAGRPDLSSMRRQYDTLRRVASAGVFDVFWPGSDGHEAEPLALGQLAGALSLMGEQRRAHDAFRLAVDNLEREGDERRGWFLWTYWSYVRDLAGLTALAADSGQDQLAQSLIDKFGALNLSTPLLGTQEKAALLSAAHAMNRDEPGRAVSVNGTAVDPLKLPAEFSPTAEQVSAGYGIANTGTKPLWRTVTVTGAPNEALPALEAGYSLDRQTLALDGKTLDPAHLRQNDRFIVVLHGQAGDDNDHRTAIVDPLPAAWEIEAVVSSPDTYPFVGSLTDTRVAEKRDDRYVAAFDLGSGLNGDRSGEVDDSKKGPPPLGVSEFRVAYVVRVVTPGRFTRPEAVVSDMYRPQLMARTGAGETVADPR